MTASDNTEHSRIATLRAEIAEIEELIADLPSASRSRERQEAKLARLRAELAALETGAHPDVSPPAFHADQSQQSGGATGGAGNTYGDNTQIGDRVARDKAEQRVGSLQAGRDAFVATQQTIHCYFGAKPPEDAGALLSHYLDRFADECNRLRLERISGRRQTGAEQPDVPKLRLQAVYTSLTTDGPPVACLRTSTTAGRARRFVERLERVERSPDDVAPERVIVAIVASNTGKLPYAQVGGRMMRNSGEHSGLDNVADETELVVELQRPELAIEAIERQRRLVLLGEPGSGKSTVLRYLGYLLAQRASGKNVRLAGWAEHDTPVPILVPLAQVAEQLGRSITPDDALWQILGNILEGPQGLSAGLRDALREALRRGGVILLCDGLDELSAEGGDQSPRTLVSQALRRLAGRTKSRVVVTSRVLPYRQAGGWQLPEADDWQTRTITPLAFGQVRTFVKAWFRGIADLEGDLAAEDADAQADDLINQLATHAALRPLVASPLLLMMLALLHDNSRIPDNEVELYEQCVILLLDRWEPVRQPNMPRRPGLVERLGSPPGLTLERLREPLHQLAFAAHRDARGEEGRGVIADDMLLARLTKFFVRLGLDDPHQAYKTFKDVLAMEAGLLVARGDDAFAFPHLSFQEYLAACYLAHHEERATLAYEAWRGDDRERWRKILVLFAGMLTASQGLLWLKQLWARSPGGKAKTAQQYVQDVRLAALTYHAMGGRAAFAATEVDLEVEIGSPLRSALQPLLATPTVGVPPQDLLIAGRVLGWLDDQRFPLAVHDWAASLRARGTSLSSAGEHYWRYVLGGDYRIGGWDEGEPAAIHHLADFWVARLPITVGQFARFVAEGYRDDEHWKPHGLKWRGERTAPYRWGEPQYSGANQPVLFVTWYEATAFCRWLSTQLADVLPPGYELRLPTEAEWEAAAAFAGPETRRPYPWGEPEPTLERAVYDVWKLNAPAPVGLCPAGAAACGALDMVGNVWEWTSSSFRTYPDGAQTWAEDFNQPKDFTAEEFDVPVRGGAFWNNSADVRCGARDGIHAGDDWFYGLGFRVVVSPSIAQMS